MSPIFSFVLLLFLLSIGEGDATITYAPDTACLSRITSEVDREPGEAGIYELQPPPSGTQDFSNGQGS